MKLLIKLGGTLLEQQETRQSLCEQIAGAQAAGHQTVVVHGGGKRLSRYLEKQGVSSEFRHGFRVTAPEIMDAVLRIFAGSVNHHLLAELGKAGAQAIGLSGIDAGIVQAVQLSPDLGAVGKVSRVNAAPFELLTGEGYVPTVACIAGGADGEIFNVNADQMAAACAGGFRADLMIYLTDVAGVLDGDGKRIPSLTVQGAEELIEAGVARGGMEAKLRAAISSIEQGAGRVRVAAGAEPDVILRLLAGESLGTEIVAE